MDLLKLSYKILVSYKLQATSLYQPAV